MADYLFDQGVAADSINALIKDLGELQRIASWYYRSGTRPSEYETVAYLGVPLLRALGWTPQQMAVEWDKIDIALFSRLPRGDKNLAVVVEAKKRDDAVMSYEVLLQAVGYATQPGRDECHRIICTDGIRYAVYVKGNNGHFPDSPYTPTAYLNINRMMDGYPVLKCPGAAEALRLISSDWTGEAPE